ncbi:putative odorant receptor 69a [Episyrphus balteatus]|uniref:putative odorant receptor 69a n=1 Tax=Episyrphus balteatus TaxID=286459 RepID=UPI0024861E45|nr:putative odorant receptor 69a [Episyrphus balteatus]
MKLKKSYCLYEFLEFPNRALRMGFFKIFDKENTKFSLISRILMTMGPIAAVVYHIGMLMSFLEIKIDTIPIILQISDRGAAIGLSTISLCKMFIMFMYRNNMAILIAELDEYFPGNLKLNPCFHNCEYKLEELYVFSRTLMRTSFFSLTSIAVLLNFMPLFQSSFEYFVMGQSFIFRLPTPSWFQWDKDSLWIFISNYILQSYTSLHMVAFHMAGDFMLCFFLTQMRLHYEFIVTILETIDAVEAEKDKDCLKFLINYHLKLNRYVCYIRIVDCT